jgi:hypothetical protein
VLRDARGVRSRVAAAEALARAAPWWPPDEPGEHALSYGHLVDAILRHGTGADVECWWTEVEAAGVPVTLRPPADAAPLRDRGAVGGVGGCFGGVRRRSGLTVGFATADVAPVGRVDVLDDAFGALAAVER